VIASHVRVVGIGVRRSLSVDVVEVIGADIIEGDMAERHGMNSMLDILICPPSRVRLTLSRHDRGCWFAPAGLLIVEVAATSTVAESAL
jgi:hypothetical protein